MRIVIWGVRIALLLVFFAFALVNTDRVGVDLFLGTWHAPLALILLAFFVAGALLGVAVLTPSVIRQRQELRRLARVAQPAPTTTPAPVEPPRV